MKEIFEVFLKTQVPYKPKLIFQYKGRKPFNLFNRLISFASAKLNQAQDRKQQDVNCPN